MPSADFSPAVRGDLSPLSQFPSHATSRGTGETSRGKTRNVPCMNAGFIKHAPTADGGLRGHVPARPERTTPPIRFLFVALHFRIGLPPDLAPACAGQSAAGWSRRRPCTSPNLRLRKHLVWGLPPHKLRVMPGTHVLISGDCKPSAGLACWVCYTVYPACSNLLSKRDASER